MAQYDDNDDPLQFGLDGFMEDTEGVTRFPGPALGICLSVNASDESNNLLYRLLTGTEGETAKKGSIIEASVLLVFNGVELNTVLDHVVVLQGKCSVQGPGEDEPSDWTEDLPNGCSENELVEFYGTTFDDISRLTGDWVVVDFLGGLLQCPVITNWFPSPRNRKDAATTTDGRRYLFRRNNSEIAVDKNGDMHITHRAGQYIMFHGKRVVIKNREGGMMYLDENGRVVLQDKNGNMIASDQDGWTISGDSAAVTVKNGNVSIYAVGSGSGQGNLKMVANKADIIASDIWLTGGGQSTAIGGGIKGLVHESILPDYSNLVNSVNTINDTMISFFTKLDTLATPSGSPFNPLKVTTADALLSLSTLKALTITGLVINAASAAKNFLTKIVKGE